MGMTIIIVRWVRLPLPSAVCNSLCAFWLRAEMNWDRNIEPMEMRMRI